MRLLGAEVYEVEPNPCGCRYARDILNLERVLEGLYNDGCFEDQVFNIILLNFTMEHLLNPSKFTRNLAKKTAPSGSLLLQAPCADIRGQTALAGMGNFYLLGFLRAYLEPLLGAFDRDIIAPDHWPALTVHPPTRSTPRRATPFGVNIKINCGCYI
jgi:hypothetical protein